MPPEGLNGTDTGRMIIQMFPRGAWFIDELTGAVFQVVKRRVEGELDTAWLTLNREVFLEELLLDRDDPRCGTCGTFDPDNQIYAVDNAERIRTVWVDPPPVLADPNRDGIATFEGSQPVVDIEVRTLRLGPSGD